MFQFAGICKYSEYGMHIDLMCSNHPNLRWSTKNIDFIGARSLFFKLKDRFCLESEGEECPCSIKLLQCACEYCALERTGYK
jgi:hypothetical protein